MKSSARLTYQCNLPDSAFSLSYGQEFCSQCQTSVIDFTQMSDEEIRQYIASHSGSLCVKIDSDQLRRVKGKKSSVRRSIAVAGTAALLAIATDSSAQVSDSVRTEQVENIPGAAVPVPFPVTMDSTSVSHSQEGTLKEPVEEKRPLKKRVFLRIGRRQFYVMNRAPFLGTRRGGLRGKF